MELAVDTRTGGGVAKCLYTYIKEDRAVSTLDYQDGLALDAELTHVAFSALKVPQLVPGGWTRPIAGYPRRSRRT